MTVVSFRRRLEALEGLAAPQAGPPQKDPVCTLLQGLIAHHLGGFGAANRNESVADGMARGLGYEKGRDLMDGLRAGAGAPARDDLNARWREAVGRLFALKDVAPDCDGPTFAATLEALYREMPERVRGHSFMAGCEKVFEAA